MHVPAGSLAERYGYYGAWLTILAAAPCRFSVPACRLLTHRFAIGHWRRRVGRCAHRRRPVHGGRRGHLITRIHPPIASFIHASTHSPLIAGPDDHRPQRGLDLPHPARRHRKGDHLARCWLPHSLLSSLHFTSLSPVVRPCRARCGRRSACPTITLRSALVLAPSASACLIHRCFVFRLFPTCS